jgi:hypothetical protein
MLLLAILVEGRTIMQSGAAEDDRINPDDPVPEKSRPGFSFVNPPKACISACRVVWSFSLRARATAV